MATSKFNKGRQAIEIKCGEFVEMDLLFIDRNAESQKKWHESEAFKKSVEFEKQNGSATQILLDYNKALEIIVKKDVDVEYLKTCIYSSGFIDLEEYNAYVDGDKELTRKEIELVAKVIKEIGEDEVK